MSTKIYEGLRLKPMSMVKLQKFATQLREALHPLHEELYAQLAGKIITCIVDTVMLYPDDFLERLTSEFGDVLKICDPVYIADTFISRRCQENRGKVTPDLKWNCNFDCKLVVMPVTSQKLLAVPFSEQAPFKKVISSFEGVSEYGYWNNNDKPKSVSPEEWAQRARDWEKATDCGAFSKNGFILELTHDYDVCIGSQKIIDTIPSAEIRATRQANNQVLNEFCLEIKESSPEAAGLYSLVMTAVNRLTTEAGAARLKAETERLKTLLPKITTKVLEDIQEKIEIAYNQAKAKTESMDDKEK